MAIYQLGLHAPKVDSTAYVAKEATVIGQVEIGPKSTVWAGAVIRGDNEPIQIGAASSIQEGAVLHVDQGCPLTIGDHVTIGHQVMLHGCTIGEGTLIGIQAVVLNNAVIGKDCLVGAGAIVTEGKTFPDRSLILGVPAKVVRELSDEDIAKIRGGAKGYADRAEVFNTTLKKIAD
jgi:carbonic anhydrase/acetyltransferase-like protein (isoleucine patch superfamily)